MRCVREGYVVSGTQVTVGDLQINSREEIKVHYISKNIASILVYQTNQHT